MDRSSARIFLRCRVTIDSIEEDDTDEDGGGIIGDGGTAGDLDES